MSDRVYSWDEDPIEKPNEMGEFRVLPPGEYDFTVVKLERGRHEGSAKLPPCNKATVFLKFNGCEHGETTLRHNLFLHSKCDGLLCQFFAGIGQRRHGEPLRMDWSRVVGSRGRAELEVRSYTKKGETKLREINDINRFFDPPTASGFTPPAPAPAPAPAVEDDDVIPF